MIGIAVLCLLLCGGILVFALNPDMTSSLAQKLYGNTVDMPPGTEETGEGQTSGNGNISVTLPNGMPGEMNGYVAPSMDQMQIPEDVSGKTGFTPVQPEEQQIPDQEAQNLKETLGSGETGDGLSFSAEKYPYYQMLTENQQSVYRQIYANAQDLTEKFAPEKAVSASDVKTAFEAVIGDHPEMFWLETGYSSKYLANGQCVEIDLKYNSTADDLESAKQRFDAAAQNLITGAASLDSNYEKEKYVHDALASAVTYDLTADMNQSAYSALVNGKSVCAGYARAYQYLLQQLGIPCYYCTGYSGSFSSILPFDRVKEASLPAVNIVPLFPMFPIKVRLFKSIVTEPSIAIGLVILISPSSLISPPFLIAFASCSYVVMPSP